MKYFKKILFVLFIVAMVLLMAVLGINTYIQASSSRAIDYMIDKYELNKKDIKVIKYQEYAYSDITNMIIKYLRIIMMVKLEKVI